MMSSDGKPTWPTRADRRVRKCGIYLSMSGLALFVEAITTPAART